MIHNQLKQPLDKGQNRLSLWSTAGILYQVLMDEERIIKFKKAIESVIRKGDIVVDIGTGSGILACFAIMSGARFVYAIELDPSNYKVAETVIEDNNMKDVIKLIQGNALKVALPEKSNVVICELMSTALLDEPQIKLMNYAIKNFLKKNGITIPKRAITFCEYVTTDYYHYGIKLRVPQYEWSWIASKSQKISKTTTLSEIDFTMINKEYVHCSGSMEIIQSDLLNGIRLSTRTFLTEDITHDSSMGYCPKVVIPTKSEIEVEVGNNVSYDLFYRAGYGYKSIKLGVFKTMSKL